MSISTKRTAFEEVVRLRRKDNNGRILKTGETQLKNGHYQFRIMIDGKRYSISCADLDDLRESEEKLLAVKMTGELPKQSIQTVNDAFDYWVRLKRGLKPNTFENYKYSYTHYVKGGFGKKHLSELHKSDVKRFYNLLADQRHLCANTVDCIHTVLHQVLQLAVDDGIISSNPSDRALFDLRRSHNYDYEKKTALSIDEQKLFLRYIRAHTIYNHWYPVFDVLLNTGMRIGEATALTWEDIDFENSAIHINKTLVYYSRGGKSTYSINKPKTQSGIRTIPMLGDVKSVLIEEKERKSKAELKCNVYVDGVTDFVFLNRFGDVLNYVAVNNAIKRITRDCNDEILEKTVNPDGCILLPKFSCHNLRHTFATRLFETDGLDIKVIQEILGHSDVSTTLDVYTKITEKKLSESIKIIKKRNALFK